MVLMGGFDAFARAYFDRDEDPCRFGRYVFNTCLINVVVSLFLLFAGFQIVLYKSLSMLPFLTGYT